MATGEPNLYSDFSGGVNFQSAPYLLKENQCRDARNVHSTTVGSIKKRPGMVGVLSDSTPYLDAAYPIHSIFPATSSAFIAVGKQASASNDRIVKITSSGTVSSLTSGTGKTLGKRWEFAQGPTSGGQGPIYGINGTDAAIYWDGSSSSIGAWTSSTATAVPNSCTMILYHLDKFWLSGHPSYPGRIWSTGFTSGYPDPRLFNTDYIDDVDPIDGQVITGLGKVGPYLLVFKSHKTYVLSDPTGRAYRPIHSTIGCAAKRSIVETSVGTFFLSEDMGVCVTDGVDVTPVSDNILPLLLSAADSNAANLSKACATFHRNSYFLSVPTVDPENDLTLEYQLDTKSWWIHTCSASQFALLDPSGTPKLYAAASQSKELYEAFVDGVYSDDDAAYSDCYWEGPFWPWGMPHLNKRISQFRADGQGAWETYASTAFNTDYEVLEELVWETNDTDFLFGGTGTFGGGSDEFGPAAGITERRYYTPGFGRSWSLRIVSDDPSIMEIFSISGFARPRAD